MDESASNASFFLLVSMHAIEIEDSGDILGTGGCREDHSLWAYSLRFFMSWHQ
jgi:hypothetical protein